MSNSTVSIPVSPEYAAAYAAQYEARDLPLALRLYRKLMASQPVAHEINYSRMQVHNIVKSVVPEQELFDAEMKLALAHLGDDQLESVSGERLL